MVGNRESRLRRAGSELWLAGHDGWAGVARAGFALAAINYRVTDAGRGTSFVSAETRVYAADPARRKFACYWRVIYPGSALIRRMWLRAIKRLAERTCA